MAASAGRRGGRVRLLLRTLLFAVLLGPAAAFSFSSSGPGEPRSPVRVLCGSNWSLVLQGQWMLEFYAPWCPACQQIQSTWESFAKESERLGITVAKVDVTQEPAIGSKHLSVWMASLFSMYFWRLEWSFLCHNTSYNLPVGGFMCQREFLFCSANDGVFRRYRGSRTLEDLQGYILERKWEAVEPVAGWKSPSSIMMHGMAGLFHFSGWIRQIHNYLTGTLGIHVWASYAIFVLATLLIGLLLGLILVLISDCLCPSSSKYKDETPEEAISKDNVENAALEEPEEPAEHSTDDAEETAGAKDLFDGEEAANSSAEDSEEDLALGKESGEEETEDLSEQPLAESETESSVRQRRSRGPEKEL